MRKLGKTFVWAFGIALAAALSATALYVSPYWTFRLWDRREPPFDWELLRPQGDLIAQFLRGTPFRPYEIILWAIGVFLVLSILQAIWTRIFRP